MSKFTAAEQKTLDKASAILLKHLKTSDDVFTQSRATVSFLKSKLAHLEREVFAVLYLDTQNRLIEYNELFLGSVSSCSIQPREVAKLALNLNASHVILAHNHPSGFPVPSQADKTFTLKIKECLEMFDVFTLEHIIIAKHEHFSFAEQGLI